MTKKDFLAWGKQWQYPFLVLETDQWLRHGKEYYEAADRDARILAAFRIKRWNNLAAGEPASAQSVKELEPIMPHRARKAREKRREYASGVRKA